MVGKGRSLEGRLVSFHLAEVGLEGVQRKTMAERDLIVITICTAFQSDMIAG